MTIRVLIVDDHPLFREGLRALIADSPETESAGVAADGQQAVAAALEQRPDVVVMDLRMPGLNGVEATRQIVRSLSDQMHDAAKPFLDAREAFKTRHEYASGLVVSEEAKRLSTLYEAAATWLDKQATQEERVDHTDVFFAETILRAPARTLRARSEFWMHLSYNTGHADPAQVSPLALTREYGRLASLFDAHLSSFERKRYENLSHEPNKAMNLNTYIGLIGGSYSEVKKQGILHLEKTSQADADLVVQPADFLITLDADSLLLPEYALRLVHLMNSPGNERIAVAQTPYSAIPHAQADLERIAGATTDIQYLVHQGFTQHKATYWVGANAVLRYAALQEIVVTETERGHTIQRYIQDRTVIEDTESTVDLLCRGWTLYNYPERLAYSATPPDFGSLAVQRGRWANGGLIILPKLLRYLARGPQRLHKLREGFFRVHYLTSIAGVNVGLVLMLAYPFPDVFQSPWLPATALPYYVLYARDLWLSGYRLKLDLLRVYALNLLLLPVNLGGVMRSLHQAAMGHKIPFRRTPKVAGRTRVDAAYVAAEFAITVACLLIGAWYAERGHVAQSVFALVNGAFFIYGIHVFLGWRNALSDLRSGWDEQMASMLGNDLSNTARQ